MCKPAMPNLVPRLKPQIWPDPNPKPWLTWVAISICFPQYDETFFGMYGLEESSSKQENGGGLMEEGAWSYLPHVTWICMCRTKAGFTLR